MDLTELAIHIAATPSDETAEPEGSPCQSQSSGESTGSSSEEDQDDRHPRGPKISSLMRHMIEDVRALCQISLLISRPGFSRRYLHSTGNNEYDPRVAFYADYDIRHIKEKFYHWNQPRCDATGEPRAGRVGELQDILIQRLAKANTKRREQLLYWSQHPDMHPVSATRVERTVPILAAHMSLDSRREWAGSGPQAQAAPVGTQSTLTKKSFSTVVVSDVSDTPTGLDQARTIYAESRVGNRKSNRVPEIPMAAGKNPSFKCPYCGIILPSGKMRNRLQWK